MSHSSHQIAELDMLRPDIEEGSSKLAPLCFHWSLADAETDHSIMRKEISTTSQKCFIKMD